MLLFFIKLYYMSLTLNLNKVLFVNEKYQNNYNDCLYLYFIYFRHYFF